MLPIVLDVTGQQIIVVGDGTAATKRLKLLQEAGIADPRVFAASALPSDSDLVGARLVFITDRHAAYATDIAAKGRAAGALVHIEDDPAASDLHMPAVLRRGDLMLTVSTGGASPALASRLKRALGEIFGPEWHHHVAEVATLRRTWRAAGADPDSLKWRTEELIERRRWLPRVSSSATDSH